MAYFQCNWYSNVLGMDALVDIIIPQQTTKNVGSTNEPAATDIPVLYLLHGMTGNHTSWQRLSSIERYALAKNIAVVMPSTDLGFYTNTTYDMNYWTYVSEELPELLQIYFPLLSTKREKTFVGGLSMGGYGAAKLALLKPERFSQAIVLSAPLILRGQTDRLLEMRSAAYWEGIFGPLSDLEFSPNDPQTWIEKFSHDEATPTPRFFVACGTEDSLLPASQYYVKLLEHDQFDVEYHEGPGGHEWPFWDEWIEKGLAWLDLD